MRLLVTLAAVLLMFATVTVADDHHEDAAEEAAENEDEAEFESEDESDEDESDEDESDEDESDDERDSEEWEYELSVSSSSASIEMSRESEDDEASLEFEYDRDDAFVEVSFESESGDSEHESTLEAQFHQLLEYEDANGNGRYDAGESIVQAFDLAQDSDASLANGQRVAWSPITQQTATSDDGIAGTMLSSAAAIGAGELRFDFYVFAEATTLGPAEVAATEVKLDIIITGFPFQSSTSGVALFLDVESEVEVETDDEIERDETGVVAHLGEGSLVFA